MLLVGLLFLEHPKCLQRPENLIAPSLLIPGPTRWRLQDPPDFKTVIRTPIQQAKKSKVWCKNNFCNTDADQNAFLSSGKGRGKKATKIISVTA